MAQNLVITEAGLQVLINAEQSGTAPVVLATVGLGTGKYTATASQTTLQAPFKTLNAVAGGIVGDNVIHLTVTDSSTDQYECFEIGVYTDGGILFAAVSSNTPIIEKASGAQAMLAIDFVLTSASPETITVGDTTITVAPATTEIQGVVELATGAETIAGTDATRAVTPAGLATLTATTERTGLVKLAIDAEATAGTNRSVAVTPYHLVQGILEKVPVSIGSGTKHVYTDANGKITASGSTVGSATNPVYMNAGTITATGGTWIKQSAASLAESGYCQLSNELMLQWGRYSVTGSNSPTVTFPKAFSSACYSVVMSMGAWSDDPMNIGAISKTGFKINTYSDTTYSQTIKYIAIGK